MRANVKKSKVMLYKSIDREGTLVRLRGELREEVNCFRCMEIDVALNSRMEMQNELTNRI